MPGKMYALLPWPGRKILPLYLTGGNGEPELKMTRPYSGE